MDVSPSRGLAVTNAANDPIELFQDKFAISDVGVDPIPAVIFRAPETIRRDGFRGQGQKHGAMSGRLSSVKFVTKLPEFVA